MLKIAWPLHFMKALRQARKKGQGLKTDWQVHMLQLFLTSKGQLLETAEILLQMLQAPHEITGKTQGIQLGKLNAEQALIESHTETQQFQATWKLHIRQALVESVAQPWTGGQSRCKSAGGCKRGNAKPGTEHSFRICLVFTYEHAQGFDIMHICPTGKRHQSIGKTG